jgi:hypothetical protein
MKWFITIKFYFNYPSIRRAVSLSLLQEKVISWQKRDEQNIKDILIVKKYFFF